MKQNHLNKKHWIVLIFLFVMTFGFLLLNTEVNMSSLNQKFHFLSVDEGKAVSLEYANYTDIPACTKPLPIMDDETARLKYKVVKDIPMNMLRNNKYQPKKFPSCGFDGVFPWRYAETRDVKEVFKHRLVVLLKSAPQNIIRRNIIRQTWGGIKEIKEEKIAVIFVIGNSKNGSQHYIESENEYFGDLLQCDFKDSYEMLVIKLFCMLKWLHESVLDYDYLAITDDDIAFRVDILMDYFDKNDAWLINNEHLVCGFQMSTVARPSRNHQATNGKWFTSKEAYSGNIYPYYCNGPGYAMTRPMAESLYCVAQLTDFGSFIWEDIIITGILREKLGDGNSNIRMHPTQVIVGHSEQTGAEERMKRTWDSWTGTKNFNSFLKHQSVFAPYDNNNEKINDLVKYWSGND